MTLTARETSTHRMFTVLHREIIPRVPLSLWDALEPGGAVQLADSHLFRIAAQYEAGEATRDQVVAAAEQLRAAWEAALRQHSTSRSA